jgi:hypothetical protein
VEQTNTKRTENLKSECNTRRSEAKSEEGVEIEIAASNLNDGTKRHKAALANATADAEAAFTTTVGDLTATLNDVTAKHDDAKKVRDEAELVKNQHTGAYDAAVNATRQAIGALGNETRASKAAARGIKNDVFTEAVAALNATVGQASGVREESLKGCQGANNLTLRVLQQEQDTVDQLAAAGKKLNLCKTAADTAKSDPVAVAAAGVAAGEATKVEATAAAAALEAKAAPPAKTPEEVAADTKAEAKAEVEAAAEDKAEAAPKVVKALAPKAIDFEKRRGLSDKDALSALNSLSLPATSLIEMVRLKWRLQHDGAPCHNLTLNHKSIIHVVRLRRTCNTRRLVPHAPHDPPSYTRTHTAVVLDPKTCSLICVALSFTTCFALTVFHLPLLAPLALLSHSTHYIHTRTRSTRSSNRAFPPPLASLNPLPSLARSHRI